MTKDHPQGTSPGAHDPGMPVWPSGCWAGGAGSSGWSGGLSGGRSGSGSGEGVVGQRVEPAGWGHCPVVGAAEPAVLVVELVVVLVAEQDEVGQVGGAAVGPVDDVVGLAL